MPKKNGFPMPTAKNEFHILNLYPKIYMFQKIPIFLCQFTRKFPNLVLLHTLLGRQLGYYYCIYSSTCRIVRKRVPR